MSCPYFEPSAPMQWTSWRGLLRPPLGAPHAGVCRCGVEAARPSEAELLESCNMGYAAGRCARFRPGCGDAVRFAIAGGVVRWLIEAGGLPVTAGELALEAIEAGAAPDGAPGPVAAQMRAYVAAYRASLDGVA